MKIIKRGLHLVIFLLLSVILTAPFSIARAQSGKVSQSPQSVPTPAPVPPDRSPIGTEPGNRDEGKYRLVFGTSNEGKLSYTWDEKAEMMRARISSVKNISEQLNALGADGYRIVATMPTGNKAAVVVRDEGQYEYEFFETEGSYHFTKSGLSSKLESMSDKGFRIIAHSQLGTHCEWFDSKEPAMGENCEYSDRFLFEREKKVRRPRKQIVVGIAPGWGAKPGDAMEKQINEKLAEGFYPVRLFSRFELLLEKDENEGDVLQSIDNDVQVVRASWIRDDLESKVNDLAKQGYRLAMTHNKIAVMYRNAETAQIPVSYIWVKAKKKKFEANLKELQTTGAIYRTVYPSENGYENSLIFERKLKDDGERREFKVLKFEFKSEENSRQKIVSTRLTPSAEEAVKTMNALAEKGYVVRDMFFSGQVSVIMERAAR